MSSKVLEVGSVNVFEKYNFCHQNTAIGTFKYSLNTYQRMAGLWYTCRWSTVKIQSSCFFCGGQGSSGVTSGQTMKNLLTGGLKVGRLDRIHT